MTMSLVETLGNLLSPQRESRNAAESSLESLERDTGIDLGT